MYTNVHSRGSNNIWRSFYTYVTAFFAEPNQTEPSRAGPTYIILAADVANSRRMKERTNERTHLTTATATAALERRLHHLFLSRY